MSDTQWNCPKRRGSAVCQIDYSTDARTCVHCGIDTLSLIVGGRMVYIMSDIFDGEKENSIMVQQVNCQGKMGSGLAKAIRDRYPQVWQQYKAEYDLGLLTLGYTSFVEVDNNSLVANICGQDRYGYDGKQYTNYDGLREGLEFVKMMSEEMKLDVVIPYKLGCGLGGGDWRGVVEPMIDEIFSNRLVVTVVQKEMM